MRVRTANGARSSYQGTHPAQKITDIFNTSGDTTVERDLGTTMLWQKLYFLFHRKF